MQQTKNTANRRRQHGLGLCATLLCLSVAEADSTDVSGYLTATTDYVRRGVSQSDSEPALQLGLDVSFESGFYIGAWGSTTDISNGPSRQRDIEADYYAGYSAEVTRQWSVGVRAIRYMYPDMEGNADYDYAEYMLVANYDDRVWFEYAWSDGLYHAQFNTHNFEVYGEQPLGNTWTVGGGAGYYDVSTLSGVGYGYWELGASRPIGRFDLDLRYHGTNRAVLFFSSPDRADSRVTLSLQLSF